MSVLLLSNMAERPYYFEKLNIGIYSQQELSYVILHYPLIALSGLPDEELVDWIGNGLHMEGLSERLSSDLRSGESGENMLLRILESGNYCTPQEIRAFRNMILEFKKLPKYKALRETARAYFSAGRYSISEEKLNETVAEMNIFSIEARDEDERKLIAAEKADVLCDLVAVRMLRFDREGALRFLSKAEQAGRFQRAEEYRYLSTGEAELPDGVREELDEKKRRLTEEEESGPECTKIKETFSADSQSFLSEAKETVAAWKKEYRKTG